MLTRPFPLTSEKLKEMAGGKEFVSMQYVILEVYRLRAAARLRARASRRALRLVWHSR